jgi:hypothetical protein
LESSVFILGINPKNEKGNDDDNDDPNKKLVIDTKSRELSLLIEEPKKKEDNDDDDDNPNPSVLIHFLIKLKKIFRKLF